MTRVQLFVGTKNGLFRFDSDGERRTWRLSGPFLAGWTITALEFAPGPEDRLLAATSHLAYGPVVRGSTDGGETWRQFLGSPRYAPGAEETGDLRERPTVKQIWTIAACGPQAPGRFYAGVEDAGVFASRDGGANWQELRSFAGTHRERPHARRDGVAVDAVLVDRGAPERMWVSARRMGVYRSADGGASFAPCDAGLPPIVMAALSPRRSGEIFAQTAGGMYRTTDGGGTWAPAMEGLPSRFGFALRVAADGTAYTVPLESQTERHVKGGRLRVYRRASGSASWEALDRGLPTHPYYAGVLRAALDADDLEPQGVYFGTTAGEVFASSDAGANWFQLPGGFSRITLVRVRAM